MSCRGPNGSSFHDSGPAHGDCDTRCKLLLGSVCDTASASVPEVDPTPEVIFPLKVLDLEIGWES